MVAPHSLWSVDDLARLPHFGFAPGRDEGGVRALFFENEPWRGQNTQVFAFLGLPEAAQTAKVPGVVLVHGGGGTAFSDWVKLWNRRGYAALALDTGGCVAGGEHGKRPRHEAGGPPGSGGFSQTGWDTRDQWTYHAVAAILRGRALLAAQNGVDESKIGLTGISWGGVLTAIAASLEPRWAFAAPVYGCGFLGEDSAMKARIGVLEPAHREFWTRNFDPASHLARCQVPLLWLNGTNDSHFPLSSWQKSHQLSHAKKWLCLRPQMQHGQDQGAAPLEIRAFAESCTREGEPLLEIAACGEENGEVWVRWKDRAAAQSAVLVWTAERGAWKERVWRQETANLDGAAKIARAKLPREASAYFWNLTDARQLLASSEIVSRHSNG